MLFYPGLDHAVVFDTKVLGRYYFLICLPSVNTVCHLDCQINITITIRYGNMDCICENELITNIDMDILLTIITTIELEGIISKLYLQLVTRTYAAMPFLLPVHPFASNLYAIRLSSCFTRGSPSIIMVLTRGATRRSAPIAAADEVPERAAKRLKATSSVIERSKKETAIGSSAANDLSVTGKGKNEPRPEDYPERVTSPWKVGVHVSAAGGVENAVRNAAAVGYGLIPDDLAI